MSKIEYTYDELIIINREQQARIIELEFVIAKNENFYVEHMRAVIENKQSRITALEGALRKVIEWFHPGTIQEEHTAWPIVKLVEEALSGSKLVELFQALLEEHNQATSAINGYQNVWKSKV